MSENGSSADNQQERLYLNGWIVGFVDGEGCFSISIFRNPKTKYGWQIMPEFVVTQSKRSLSVLNMMKDYFQCGKIFINRRYDNHRQHVYRYCVRRLQDLREIIIPFFIQNSLKTAKNKDFLIFCKIVKRMENKEHYSISGLKKIAKEFGKNIDKESSETIRQAPRRRRVKI
jgi:hypothetical protein